MHQSAGRIGKGLNMCGLSEIRQKGARHVEYGWWHVEQSQGKWNRARVIPGGLEHVSESLYRSECIRMHQWGTRHVWQGSEHVGGCVGCISGGGGTPRRGRACQNISEGPGVHGCVLEGLGVHAQHVGGGGAGKAVGHGLTAGARCRGRGMCWGATAQVGWVGDMSKRGGMHPDRVGPVRRSLGSRRPFGVAVVHWRRLGHVGEGHGGPTMWDRHGMSLGGPRACGLAVVLGCMLGSWGMHWGPGKHGTESGACPRGMGGMPKVWGVPEEVAAQGTSGRLGHM